MKTIRLVSIGRVQRVGYRNYIDSIAFELGVKGYVKNLEDGTVEIVIQHEDAGVINKFIKKAKVTEYPIRVSEIKQEYVDMPAFDEFNLNRGDQLTEQSERLDEAAFYLMKVHGSNKEILEVGKQNLETSRSIEKNLDRFSTSTSKRFDVVDTKYGKISDRLEKISDSLEELVEILRAFKQV